MSISRLMQIASAGKASGPSEIGEAFGGGFYTGNIVEGGREYYIIVAPKSSGESTSQKFKTSRTASPLATQTLNNGPAATAAMVAAGNHPAAEFCAGLTIDGFSDWYLPARDELELIYRNLKSTSNQNQIGVRPLSPIAYPEGTDVSGDINGKNRNSSPLGDSYTLTNPPQTSVTNFVSGGAEAFSSIQYWSSSEFRNDGLSWGQLFSTGTQDPFFKDTSYYVRAVRRVPV